MASFNYGSSNMDPLSDGIVLLRPNAAISKPITGRGRWGVRYAAYDAPDLRSSLGSGLIDL